MTKRLFLSAKNLIAEQQSWEDDIYDDKILECKKNEENGKIEFIDYIEHKEYKLDPGEWFCINSFSKERDYDEQKHFVRIIEDTEIDVKDVNDNILKNLRFLCYQRDNDYFFQKITPKSISIKTFWFSKNKKELQFDKNVKILTINDEPDAIYFKESDQLIFKKFSSIKTMFKLEFIHKTLNDKEVINFLDKHHKIFNSVEIKLLPTKIHAHNRSLMSQIEHIYEKDNREDILKYILSFYDKEKLIIEKNDELKSFLYGLNERLYQTPVTNEKKVANSVIEFKLN